MNEREYNEKLLTEYLLGALPDERAEKFDERSFSDEDFSTALKVAENDLIDAYIQGELRDADLKRFHSYYLSSTLRREKVKFAKSLQTYSEKEIAALKSAKRHFVETKSAGQTGFLSSWIFFTNPVLRWSAAAFLLLLAALSGFWLNRKINQPEMEIVSTRETPSPSNIELPARNKNTSAMSRQTPGGENFPSESETEKTNKLPAIEASRISKPEKTVIPPKFAVASFILAPPLRGGNGLPKISFPKETTLILMTLKTESADYKSYRVALVDESNKKLWQSGTVKVKNEAINISFPANLLKKRIYSMALSGIRDDGEAEIISNYSFGAAPK